MERCKCFVVLIVILLNMVNLQGGGEAARASYGPLNKSSSVGSLRGNGSELQRRHHEAAECARNDALRWQREQRELAVLRHLRKQDSGVVAPYVQGVAEKRVSAADFCAIDQRAREGRLNEGAVHRIYLRDQSRCWGLTCDILLVTFSFVGLLLMFQMVPAVLEVWRVKQQY